MLSLLCEHAGKQVQENALGHHQGALPFLDVLSGDDKGISLLFRAQPEKAWQARWD